MMAIMPPMVRARPVFSGQRTRPETRPVRSYLGDFEQ